MIRHRKRGFNRCGHSQGVALTINDTDMAGAGQFERTVIMKLCRQRVVWLPWLGYPQ